MTTAESEQTRSRRPFGQWIDGPTASLEPHVRAWLDEHLGSLTPAAPVDPAIINVPPSRIKASTLGALVAAIGQENVRQDRLARLRHSAGSSYDDLLRLRSGLDLAIPDAVLSPADEAEVVALLRVAEDHDLAVVPLGGGTSVVGGVEPANGTRSAAVVVDLSRMSGMVNLDPINRTATFLPGTTGPRVEQVLAEHGLMLGHVPQSFARATIGGYAATRSSGQASTGFGRFDALVVSIRMATPRGLLAAGTGTPNAGGPDLRHLIVGSEGAFGVITEVTVKVRPAPQVRRYEGWMLPDFAVGTDVLRSLVQDGPRSDSAPDVCRLSDADETAIQLALRGGGARSAALNGYLRARNRSHGSLAIIGWEGNSKAVDDRRDEAISALRSAGGVSLGTSAGEAWRRHRFHAPSQRDSLLNAGVMVETLETATTWRNVGQLRAAIRAALHADLARHGTPPVVLTHLSHLYSTGASLYITVLAKRVDGDTDAAREQWRSAKTAVTDAIVANGGAVSHHHAIGRDHRPWLPTEVGELGIGVLSAVKNTLDPAGVMNPGALV